MGLAPESAGDHLAAPAWFAHPSPERMRPGQRVDGTIDTL